jgi:hypothetical protein
MTLRSGFGKFGVAAGGAAAQIIYPGSATTVSTHPDGNKIIQFTSSGTLELVGQDLVIDNYLVIGSGGGAGTYNSGGGGGAGAYREATNLTIPAGTHAITISAGGRGGLGQLTPDSIGFGGGNTHIGTLITGRGGGGGGAYNGTPLGNPHYTQNGTFGNPYDTPSTIKINGFGLNYTDGPGSATVETIAGSAGGHSSYCPVALPGTYAPWSHDNVPTVFPSPGYGGGTPGGSYGNAGGGVSGSPWMVAPNSSPTNPNPTADGRNGGGGGGAGQAGKWATGGPGGVYGVGGAGTASSITGSAVTRAGGGAGSSFYAVNNPGGTAGGAGGGGASGYTPGPAVPSIAGGAGTVNTGGGGGGSNLSGPGASGIELAVGGAGGCGLVVLKYAHPDALTIVET